LWANRAWQFPADKHGTGTTYSRCQCSVDLEEERSLSSEVSNPGNASQPMPDAFVLVSLSAAEPESLDVEMLCFSN